MNSSFDLLDKFCDYVVNLINYYLSKKITPDLLIYDIKELSPDCLDDLRLNGIKGLILDLDETLRFNKEEIPPLNKEWLLLAKRKLKIIILSNGYCASTEKYLKSMDIAYLGLAYKPWKRSFQKALKSLDLSPTEVLMVGDDYFSDIYGGKRSNLGTVLVRKKIK